jgi:hypothetical protein
MIHIDHRLASSEPGSKVYACWDDAPAAVGDEMFKNGCCTPRVPFRVPEREGPLPDDTPEPEVTPAESVLRS